MIRILASYYDKVEQVVLENAPKFAKYTSPTIQKEILHVIASKVQRKICEDIGDSKFCIIVDESRDESKREQMTLVLRFADNEGFIQERFFDLSHVKDIAALTLKNEIYAILSRHCLDIQNIHGQGYDGASNMCGEWKGLQTLVLNDCPYTYYVYCFAHQLQLALVAASREEISIHEFFLHLNFIITKVGSSCKRNDELRATQVAEIARMLAIDELETGTRANQVGTLKRDGDSCWGSHFNSICSLMSMFGPTCLVLENTKEDGSTYLQRGDANVAHKMINSFEFIFSLHLMKEIMGITDVLCQALLQKSLDISNAQNLVSATKTLIQILRVDGWDNFLESVTGFSKIFEGRGRRKRDHVTVEHHYHFDIFNATIDVQLQELDNRLGEQPIELLTLCSALDPKDANKSFNVNDICCLVEKYYPLDFSKRDRIGLKIQLKLFEHDVQNHLKFQNLSSIAELCRRLVETKKS
ncbi:zinc finger MYM-type protein 1-like [Quercus lobata]|uniref:zinc finger MYM-type protein 1-like n=1 Tax=Quercus lobata TaxID=97700 RepID=UPI0012444509|nr:zinc finger MYM-type protein 1-like [Quercus lobata]